MGRREGGGEEDGQESTARQGACVGEEAWGVGVAGSEGSGTCWRSFEQENHGVTTQVGLAGERRPGVLSSERMNSVPKRKKT